MRQDWLTALVVAWLMCLPLGYAHGASRPHDFRTSANKICAAAARELDPLDRRLVKIYDALQANEPAARTEYASLVTSTIAIHRRADRRLADIHPPRALTRRYRAMIAADRLLFGPRAQRVASLYRQRSSPENDAEIQRHGKVAKSRAKRFQELVRLLRLSDCRNFD